MLPSGGQFLFDMGMLGQLDVEPVSYTHLGGGDEVLIRKCMGESWRHTGKWYGETLKYLIENENYRMIFSHFHNIDAQGHMLVKYLKDRGKNVLPEEKIVELLENVYKDTDDYIGQFLYLLDEGWTIFIVSDHGQICGEYEPPRCV